MATKIKLMRLGKMRDPHYRSVVADARTKRDGRSIETIGEYHPKHDPSIIDTASQFYAQHSTLVKTLGGMAMTLALAHIAEKQGRT